MSETNLNTHTQVEMEPPKSTVGIIGWLRKNLFSSWGNTILTIITAAFLYLILSNVIIWIITSGDWKVITENYKLFFVGQYPDESAWRVWLSFSFITLLFGFSAGIWRGTMQQLLFVLMGVLVLNILLPFVSGHAKMWLIINIALLVIGYFIVRKIPKNKIVTNIGWFLSFPIMIFLLDGFGLFQQVTTNLWGGLLLTALISIVSIVLSFPLGILLALGRTSKKLFIIRWFCISFIELVRGVPLITILFMAQIMIPLFLGGINIDNLIRVCTGTTLFTAAYLAENIRGGLQSIPRGQYEAGQAVGLNATLLMTFIIMPQALRSVIPTIVGQFISIFKDTSLVAIVGLIDLLGIAQTVSANPEFLGKQMETFFFIGIIYWTVAFSMSYASRRLEKQLGVGER